jgi:hypothetical protein
MHNVVLSPIDSEILINSISDRVIANILSAIDEQPTNPDTYLKGKRTTHKGRGSVNARQSQLETVFRYLRTHIATASMVSDATGVPQKSICRYKRNLEKAGLLWETERKRCKKTGRKACYLTTDPDQVAKYQSPQLSLAFPSVQMG